MDGDLVGWTVVTAGLMVPGKLAMGHWTLTVKYPKVGGET